MLTYEPLLNAKEQIRLLHHVKQIDGKLAFELTTASVGILDTSPLRQKQSFNAISYTWGDPTALAEVIINEATVTIRQNAYDALSQHVLHHLDDDVWMDSICINQNDLLEKSQQVEVMSDIYLAADLVCCCVGAHADDSEILLPFFDQLLAAKEAAQKIRRIGKHGAQLRDWLLQKNREYIARTYAALTSFAERPYWTRLWIVQENHRARYSEILCGGDVIDWYPIRMFMEELNAALVGRPELSTYEQCLVSILGHAQVLNRSPIAALLDVLDGDIMGDTADMLRAFGGFGCADRRDRIYDLRPLMRSADFVPDYSQSSFDLALEVVASLSKEYLEPHLIRLSQLADVRVVLQALGIEHNCKEMRAARSSRSTNHRATFVGLETINREVHSPSREPSHAQRWKRAVQLTTAAAGNLTAHLQEVADMSSDPTKTDSTQLLLSGEPSVVSCSRADAKELMVGSLIAAFVCRDARAGDFLVPMEEESGQGQALVVTRRLDEDFFLIIGQGFTTSGYRFCLKSDCVAAGQHIRLGIDVVLSPLDAIVLVGQDLAVTTEQNDVHNRLARTTRLDSMPSAHYRVAAVQHPKYDGSGIMSVDM